MTDPEHIVVAGDWHANAAWAVDVIGQAKKLLADERRRIILHCGDFGVWPGATGAYFLREVAGALSLWEDDIWFVDGNHEDHDQLDLIRKISPYSRGKMSVASGVWWLPRGYRWEWHDRTWLAVGGAVSPDKAARIPGISWWPQEEITDKQEAVIIAGGHADVLVSHDCPAGVRHTFPPPPAFWDYRDLARLEAHRERLQRIVDAVQPRWIIHGHLHIAYSRQVDFGYGPVEVTGMNCDERPGNFSLLNVEKMEWQ
jgi:hypothetical protein